MKKIYIMTNLIVLILSLSDFKIGKPISNKK